MLKNIDKRLRLVIGTFFIIGALFGGLIGYDLKNIGQQDYVKKQLQQLSCLVSLSKNVRIQVVSI